MARPTIEDVASRAGVSKSAVSFALNGRPGLAEDTRQRILAAAADLGWRPSARARSLAADRAFALGLVVARAPHLLGSDPFFPGFIAGVETVLAEHSHCLVLQVVAEPTAEVAGYRRLHAAGSVDGVFLTDLRNDDPRIPLLRSLCLPAVTLNRPDVPSPFPAVCCDDSAGVRAAVAHLVDLGHTAVAFVAGPATYLHAARRCAAFTAALAAAGLPAGLVVPGDFTAAGGAAATRQLLTGRQRPTAIVYANDVMAIAGLAVAAELGVAVPGELSVIGFDDIPLAAHVHPPLTTVRADPMAWGAQAARTLLGLIGSGAADDVELDPAVLIRRASTAEAPGPTPAPPGGTSALATVR